MKRMLICLLAAVVLTALLPAALAATVNDRIDAVERELGINHGDQPLNVRVSLAESALGLFAGDDQTIIERLEALEQQLGMDGNAAPMPAPFPEEAVSLADLEPFSNDSIAIGFRESCSTDSYGGDHVDMLMPYLDEGVVEYLLNGEYSELRATVYIPRASMSEITTSDLGRVKLVVYGDDKVLYTLPKLGLKDEPLDISVDLTGVKFMRIAFENDYVSFKTIVVLGDAVLVK